MDQRLETRDQVEVRLAVWVASGQLVDLAVGAEERGEEKWLHRDCILAAQNLMSMPKGYTKFLTGPCCLQLVVPPKPAAQVCEPCPSPASAPSSSAEPEQEVSAVAQQQSLS